jgi:CRP-like cAMP-binding protein
LASDELKWLAEIQVTPSVVERGKQPIQEGQNGHRVFVLQAGWTCGYKNLPNGGRQIISFPIAGDCVGLRSALLRTADHSFSALTDAVVSSVEGEDILKGITEYPRLGAAIMWAATREEAMVVEHLVNVRQRNAIERTAHFFMELAERLNLVGLATETEFKCPLSQSVLADALGLTDIHVSRVLRQLHERDLLTMKKGTVKIPRSPRAQEARWIPRRLSELTRLTATGTGRRVAAHPLDHRKSTSPSRRSVPEGNSATISTTVSGPAPQARRTASTARQGPQSQRRRSPRPGVRHQGVWPSLGRPNLLVMPYPSCMEVVRGERLALRQDPYC